MNAILEAPLDETAIFDPEAKPRRRILVADDDVDLRHLIVEVLIGAEYEVDDADNGARAWKAVHLKHYDLLITDHEMPEMTGLQLVDKLRSARFDLPIIIATGSLLPELMAKCMRINFVSILPKPFTLEELKQTVERSLPSPRPNVLTLFPDQRNVRENYRRC